MIDVDVDVLIGAITGDPCPPNNAKTRRTTITRVTDVYVTKSDVLDPVMAGGEARYRIRFGNTGPSNAAQVRVTDTLPIGFKFNRCAPLDPNDNVACQVISGDGVNTPQVVRLDAITMTNMIMFEDLGELAAGAAFEYYLVADVDPGYLLDGRGDVGPGAACQAFADATGHPFWAANEIQIGSSKDRGRVKNNFDTECTRVEGKADLRVEKTDVLDDGDGFLECDPVGPGGMVTYKVVVTNDGMADAADVFLVDQLPAEGVALDPAQVMVEVEGDPEAFVDVRDDGRITVRLGNDPSLMRMGPTQRGRLNAGNSVTVTIGVMVLQSAECGSVLNNMARVETRENVIDFPAQSTPTRDPVPGNNDTAESTQVECASLAIRKTVAVNGQCPGRGGQVQVPVGRDVTFCLEVTNTGSTYLTNVRITDTLKTSREPWPMTVFTTTLRGGADPKIPLRPGETVSLSYTVPGDLIECGLVMNGATATAEAVNSGFTPLPCVPVEPAPETAVSLFVPCGGADTRLQLPVLDTGECDTWIQIQNVGTEPTTGMLVIWGDPGACPPQAAGPLKTECTGLLRPGSAWTFTGDLLPAGSRSAIVYTLNAQDIVSGPDGNEKPFDQLACESLFNLIVGNHARWFDFDRAYSNGGVFRGPLGNFGQQVELDFGAHIGQPLAVSVNRTCADPTDPNRAVSAAYTGIGTDAHGVENTIDGGYTYHAPLIYAGLAELNSTMYIHNSGIRCTSLEIWFASIDNCLRPILGDVLSLAPGETVSFDPNTVVGPGWLGSAWIRSSQPLGLVIDTLGPNHFTSYRGVPGDLDLPAQGEFFTLGSQINYAPLTYSEYQGWDSAIAVQNLSGIYAAKVKVYFLDRSGDIITTLIDWICPHGTQIFFLPVIEGIPGNWVGSARVESQEWTSGGTPLVDPPRIQSVVMLEKWSDPARTERREAVAYNALTEQLAYDWQIGTRKGGLSDGSAVIAIPILAKGNRGITSELAITNLVPKPGFTDFAIYIYDQNGLVDYYCQKLNEKQVEYIDFNAQGAIRQGFLGSAVISATFWEHDVFDSQGQFQRNLVGLGAVAVERIGGTLGEPDVPGDESKAFEGIPIFTPYVPQRIPLCPGQGGAPPTGPRD